LFWDPENLQAACTPRNFGDGARLRAASNRSDRQQVANLERTIEELVAEIDELYVRLARCENGSSPEPAPNRPQPQIF
jgi:hypothetical protein